MDRRVDLQRSPKLGARECDARPQGKASRVRFSPAALTRRSVMGGLAGAVFATWFDRAFADSADDPLKVIEFSPTDKYLLYETTLSKVVPPAGYQSRIALQDSVIRLVRAGVIDLGKFFDLQRRAVKSPDGLSQVLAEPSPNPIWLTRDNASAYVNLLWPIGLANRMNGNFTSPLSGASAPSFASTAGWTLGDRAEGSGYFNRFPIVEMTLAQESLAIRVAKSTFRPCCDNSTFFQDCNHGSALLGVLQLGAAQGLDEAELYREALAFNPFWFADYYVRTALYFIIVRKIAWDEVDPKEVMGPTFSALSSWRRIVQARVDTIPNLIPKSQEDANCGA